MIKAALILFFISFGSVVRAGQPTAKEIDSSCKWHSRRMSTLNGNLGSRTLPASQCNLKSPINVCSGFIECDKTFAVPLGQDSGRLHLQKGINNPVACVTNDSCENVTPSTCFLDKNAKPRTDFLDTVMFKKAEDTSSAAQILRE